MYIRSDSIWNSGVSEEKKTQTKQYLTSRKSSAIRYHRFPHGTAKISKQSKADHSEKKKSALKPSKDLRKISDMERVKLWIRITGNFSETSLDSFEKFLEKSITLVHLNVQNLKNKFVSYKQSSEDLISLH